MRTLAELVRDAEPFPAKVIKKLPPRNENYVSWNQYAQRLLLHHGGHAYRVTHVVFGGNPAPRCPLVPQPLFEGDSSSSYRPDSRPVMWWRIRRRARRIHTETELLDALREGTVFWW